MKAYSIAEARHDLAHLVHEAEIGQYIQLTRHGQPVAVLISEHEFERLHGKTTGFWQAFQQFSKKFSGVKITRKDFNPSRSKSKGRVSPWK